jgi:hypothetical protein
MRSDRENMTIMPWGDKRGGVAMKSTQLGLIRERGLVDTGLGPNNGEWSVDRAGERLGVRESSGIAGV